jgi:Carboxypeptidase regulatory-like domain
MCRCAKTLIALTGMMFIPSLTFAQATLAGSVKDMSGAVLPGVTVEAASPALIEKVRIALTDSSGQYRIEDLRPGQYTVTFKLSGFAAVTREGLTVSGAARFR